jgi:hypothetical protein
MNFKNMLNIRIAHLPGATGENEESLCQNHFWAEAESRNNPNDWYLLHRCVMW